MSETDNGISSNYRYQQSKRRSKFPRDEAHGFFRKEPVTDISTDNLEDPDRIEAIDVSEERAEKIARGYFVGSTAVGRRRDVRKLLEEKVVGKIGKSGKLLVDKLFVLIEGVWLISSIKTVNGVKEVQAYQEPPNLQAIIYALDRVLGKPKQLNVQATFSLSELLINDNTKKEGFNLTQHNGNGNGIRQSDNERISKESDSFHLESLGT